MMLWHYELENLEDLNESAELNEHIKTTYGQVCEISVFMISARSIGSDSPEPLNRFRLSRAFAAPIAGA